MSESEVMFTMGEHPAGPMESERYVVVSGATIPSDPLIQRTLTAVVSGLSQPACLAQGSDSFTHGRHAIKGSALIEITNVQTHMGIAIIGAHEDIRSQSVL